MFDWAWRSIPWPLNAPCYGPWRAPNQHSVILRGYFVIKSRLNGLKDWAAVSVGRYAILVATLTDQTLLLARCLELSSVSQQRLHLSFSTLLHFSGVVSSGQKTPQLIVSPEGYLQNGETCLISVRGLIRSFSLRLLLCQIAIGLLRVGLLDDRCDPDNTVLMIECRLS